MITPLYDHDCAGCTFVGRDDPQPGERVNGVDMYVHVGPRVTMLLRRSSSRFDDYGAAPLDGICTPAAYRRVFAAYVSLTEESTT